MIPVGSIRTACRYRLPSSLLLLDGREKDGEGEERIEWAEEDKGKDEAGDGLEIEVERGRYE